MRFHRGLADMEGARDLAVAEAVGELTQDVTLTRRERPVVSRSASAASAAGSDPPAARSAGARSSPCAATARVRSPTTPPSRRPSPRSPGTPPPPNWPSASSRLPIWPTSTARSSSVAAPRCSRTTPRSRASVWRAPRAVTSTRSSPRRASPRSGADQDLFIRCGGRGRGVCPRASPGLGRSEWCGPRRSGRPEVPAVRAFPWPTGRRRRAGSARCAG
jgi:hypothetical protein